MPYPKPNLSPGAQPPRRETALDTIGCIMDGARAALLAAPEATPGIAEVAHHSQLPRGVIQRHFPSGEAILEALHRRYIARRLDEYRAMLDTLPEDASSEEICATTIMAAVRAGSGQPLGLVHHRLMLAGLAHGRRHGRPLARAVAAELHAFLQRRQLLLQGEPNAELILATSLAIAEGFEYAIQEEPQLLHDPSTASRFVAWLHLSLFQPGADAPPQ